MAPSPSAPRGALPVLLLGLLALGVACGGANNPPGPDPAAADKVKPTAVSAGPALVMNVPRTLTVTGSLVAVEDADVAAEAAGAVERIAADRGDVVRAGDALLVLDSRTAGLQVQEATASVAAAEAQVEQAEADCQRARALADAGGMATADRDRVLAQCEQGNKQLEAARARLSLANLQWSRTTVRAPFGGVVAERMVSPGEYVTPGRAVVKLVSLDPLRLELSVPERAAEQVRAGAALTFSVPGAADRTWSTTVDRVSPALRERTRDLMIEATVPNGDGALRPNSFVSASLSLPDAPGLTVPATALREKGDASRVFVVRDNRAEERVVELGSRAGDRVEIRAGLSDADVVVAPIPEGLADGAPVSVQ